MRACDPIEDDTSQQDKFLKRYTINSLYTDERKIDILVALELFYDRGTKQTK